MIEVMEGKIYKYLRLPGSGREELYELRSDPDEARYLMRASPPDLVEAMREAWRKHFLSARD